MASGAGIAVGTALAIAGVGGGLAWYFLQKPGGSGLTASLSGPLTIAVGGSGTFTITASGGAPPYSYDFISSIAGAQNGASYTIKPTTTGTGTIYCVVSDSAHNSTVSNTMPFQVTATGGGCVSPDVPEYSNGTCPTDYVPDPANSGCCSPSPPAGGLEFALNQQAGSVSVQGDVGTPLYFGASGATANGPVYIAWGNNPSTMYVPIGDAAYMGIADDFGGLNVTSCVGALKTLWESVGDCAGNSLTNPFYLALYDDGSALLSNIMVVTLGSITGSDYCQFNLFQGTGAFVCPGSTTPCSGAGSYLYCKWVS